jgi:hypothetical protein
MRYAFGLLTAALLCAAPAAADARGSIVADNADKDVMTGSGLVCDTKEQAARFVSLLNDDIEQTLNEVNREAGDAQACVVTTIGFIPGSKVADVDKDGAVVHVIEVKVVAVATAIGLQPVEPKTYYSVIASNERSV